jgi:hypothetical protein
MRDKLRKTPEILFEHKINSLNLKKLPQGVTDSKIFGFISNPFNKSYRFHNLVSNETSFANFGISYDLLCILQDSASAPHEITDT